MRADVRQRRADTEALVGARQSVPSRVNGTPNAAGETSHTDPIYDRAASAVAGKQLTVRCWSRGDWSHLTAEEDAIYTAANLSSSFGFDNGDGSTVELSPVTCSWLDGLAVVGNLVTSKPSGRTAEGIFVNVLAHQSLYAKGVRDEARGECYAMQMIPIVARAFGLSRQDGRALTEGVWRRYPQEPYRAPACRNGGAFDLHPHSNVWP
jgi:hypothetical protein